MKKLLSFAAAAAGIAFAASAHAGGPLGVCYGSPVKYPGTGSVTLRYDLGTLGSRTKTQADTIVSNAIAYWTNVPTATVSLTRGADLPVDVTTANVGSYYGQWSDGINPVIYDTNGTIVDMLLGTGASNSVLGFAGSAWSDNGIACQYVEGQAIINGKIGVSDAVMQNVIAHEVGHLIGMDHTQLDSSQGLATSNYPLMYPIAYRSAMSLHEDEAAAVTALYPDSNVSSAYGEISGTFTRANGTPIRGANIFAQGSGGTFSIVSDYRMQNTGYFRMLLPPGTYTLRAEPIDTSFTGGSGVGPYADDWSQPSFQPPLYATGGTANTAPSGPMATVTLGNASPTQVTVVAGCAATATFRIDGTGSIGGNCAGIGTPAPSNPSGAIGTATPQFLWSAVSGATSYDLRVETAAGTQLYLNNYTPAAALCPGGGGACGVTPSTPLANGSYNWFVRAKNASSTSGWSAARAFSVVTATGGPDVPIPGSPSGTITTLTPMLLWTPSAGATGYNVRVMTATGATFVSVSLTLAQAQCPKNSGACGYTPPALTNNADYTWQVAATNASGASPFSGSLPFTTNVVSAGPPSVPTPGSPNGAISSGAPMFLWTPAPGATGYTLRVLTSAGVAVGSPVSLTIVQALCPKNAGACGYTFPSAFAGGSYVWSVRGDNAAGSSAYSSGMAFTVAGGSSTPGAPVPGSPSGAISTTTPMFLWTPSPGATSYTIRVMNGSTQVFSTPLSLSQALCPANSGACGYTAPTALASGMNYTWQVSAGNTAGTSAFSAPMGFVTP